MSRSFEMGRDASGRYFKRSYRTPQDGWNTLNGILGGAMAWGIIGVIAYMVIVAFFP